MATPTSAITRFDLGMTYNEFSLAANRRGFIGLRVLPPIGVAQEAASFLRLNVESYLQKPKDTKRAPKAGYQRDDYTWDQDSYAVDEHGVEEVADDATIERYGDILRVEGIAVARGVDRVLSRLEDEIADAVFNTTTWTGASLTGDIDALTSPQSGNKWTNKSGSDPIADIDYARNKVETNCGLTPNTVIMQKSDFINCIRTDRIESLLKYDGMEMLMAMGSQASQVVINRAASALAGLFQVDRVLVGQGFSNSANKGQSATFSRFWTAGYIMVCHVNNDGMNGDLESPMPNIGRTIFSTKNGEPLPGADDAGYGSLLFDEYRDEPVRGSVFRPRNKRQVKILHKEAGFLLTNAQ